MDSYLTFISCLLLTSTCFGQKWDYNYICKTFQTGSGFSISFKDSNDLEIESFAWKGTVSGSPVLSDKAGNFLGYFNCRNIYDSIGRVAINGDSMAVGFYQHYLFELFPKDVGLDNAGNSAFIPITDSLYYLFYKSSELWLGAPDFAIDYEENGYRLSSYSENLYLTKVRLRNDGRLYVMDEDKHILLQNELFQMGELSFCKHANGLDWWLLAPHAQDSLASLFLIQSNGIIDTLADVVYSDNYWRVRSMVSTTFSPDGSLMARFMVRPASGFSHILELFEFDRCHGQLNKIFETSVVLTDPYTTVGDIEFSDSGRFLFVAVGTLILQFDLMNQDPFMTCDTVAQWDGGVYYGLPVLMDQLWTLPNGEMLVASSVATPYLHYIHKPNLKGIDSDFEQRAIKLPKDPMNSPYDIYAVALPMYPPFRMKPLPGPCATSVDHLPKILDINIIPNPASDRITIPVSGHHRCEIWSVSGQVMSGCESLSTGDSFEIDVSDLPSGMYLIVIRDLEGRIVARGRFVKI